MKLTTEQFIKRCIDAHGNDYDYSGVIYINSTTKVSIVCNACRHRWDIIPGNFTFLKQGCPVCKKSKHQQRMTKTIIDQDVFLDRCKSMHNNRYDYTETIYTGSNNKIDIICREHGLFSQIAYDHSRGIGCNKCRVSRILSTKIDKGIIRNPDNISEYEKYFQKVWYQTRKNYKEYFDAINPDNLPRGKEYNLDHIFSIQQGFEYSICPKIIGHHTNLRILPAKENREKHIRCDKTISHLYEDYLRCIV